jgi:tetratricopeptide (TPR) repeat protein
MRPVKWMDMMRRLTLGLVLLSFASCARGSGDTSVARAQQQFQVGNFSAAVITLQAVSHSLPGDASVYYWLGRCYFELKNYEQAISNGERAVKLAPDNSEYLLWLGRAYGRQADAGRSFWMALRSKDALEDAVKADPNNIPARRDLAEFYMEAPWIVGGSKTKARQEVAAIAAIDPIQGELARSEFNRESGNTPRATEEMKAVLQDKPKTVEEYFELADFFASHPDAALEQRAIDGAVAIAPSDPRLLYYRGVVLALQGQQLEQSESYLKAYLARTPERSDYPPHADARTWLGHVYEQEGRKMDAAQQYQVALQLDPHSQFAKQSLSQLEQR